MPIRTFIKRSFLVFAIVQIDSSKMSYSVNDFKRIKYINKGSTAFMYKCMDLRTTNIVVMKKMEFATDKRRRQLDIQLYEDECKILKSLNNPNIINLIVSFQTPTHGFLIMEWMECDLTELIENHKGWLGMTKVKTIAKQTLQAIDYCHDLGVWHRDVKADNILIGKDGNARLADFGLARNTIDKGIASLTIDVVTPYYKAPELELKDSNYTSAIDVWSYGVTLAQMLIGAQLFKPTMKISLLEAIFKVRGTQSEETWSGFDQLPGSKKFVSKYEPQPWPLVIPRVKNHPKIIKVLEASLTCCPAKRMTAKALLKIEFFE